ncbi:hypothetical protein Mal33_03890 [Rosistilla oblonga]|uniref:Uncharacterized protein n=1 Tax=Rosistilla oblonga TaxID=2527990 RepID=A0A518IMX0_9BACT|nr:hypothetical protein Mal33_03890 [Rosistilla oblonga]
MKTKWLAGLLNHSINNPLSRSHSVFSFNLTASPLGCATLQSRGDAHAVKLEAFGSLCRWRMQISDAVFQAVELLHFVLVQNAVEYAQVVHVSDVRRTQNK